MEKYTLIAYRADGYDTCMGHVMSRWGSEFSFDNNLDAESLEERLVQMIDADSSLDYKEMENEIIILRGTTVLFDTTSQAEVDYDAEHGELSAIMDSAVKRVKMIKEHREVQKAEKEKREKHEKEEKSRAKERAEYLRLKEKFG